MLQIKKLTITHRKDLRTIIKDFSFVLNDGDKAALIGEEGNGKSTLLKLCFDEALVEDYVEYEGEIFRDGKKIGYLSQELSEAQKEKTIYEFCTEEELFFHLTPKELAEITRKFGLEEAFFYSDQKVGSLSGGEKVKLQMARILMGQPEILFLDEPSNDIDLETLEWLEDFIRESSLPILYISHDEVLLEHTANKIIHLEQIKRKTEPRYTVAVMGYREYMEKRMRGLLIQEQQARNEKREYQKQQERFRQIQQKVEHQQNTISRQDPHGGKLLKKKMKNVKSQERRFEKEYETRTEVPETEDAIFIKFGDKALIPNGKHVLDFERKEIRAGQRILLRNVELHVRGPEHICLIGKNGIGKTTLLREIEKELRGRTDIKVYYMPQDYEELLDINQTPVEFLTVTGEKEEQSRIRTYLGSMKYTEDEMNHSVAELSGGQKAKILLLKMSMEGCNVLILDEPTRNFSPLSNPVIRSMLKGFGGAIISISHDRKYIEEVGTTVYEVTEQGLRRFDAD